MEDRTHRDPNYITLYVHRSGKDQDVLRYLHVTHLFAQGVFGEAPDLRRNRHLPCQLETHCVRRHPPGI